MTWNKKAYHNNNYTLSNLKTNKKTFWNRFINIFGKHNSRNDTTTSGGILWHRQNENKARLIENMFKNMANICTKQKQWRNNNEHHFLFNPIQLRKKLKEVHKVLVVTVETGLNPLYGEGEKIQWVKVLPANSNG